MLFVTVDSLCSSDVISKSVNSCYGGVCSLIVVDWSAVYWLWVVTDRMRALSWVGPSSSDVISKSVNMSHVGNQVSNMADLISCVVYMMTHYYFTLICSDLLSCTLFYPALSFSSVALYILVYHNLTHSIFGLLSYRFPLCSTLSAPALLLFSLSLFCWFAAGRSALFYLLVSLRNQ